MRFQYSLSTFFRFLLGLSLFFWLNYLLYVNSREERGEFAGWPFRFYLDWAGIVYVHYWSTFWLAMDVAVGLLVACLFAPLRWRHLKHFWHRLRTWGTPWA